MRWRTRYGGWFKISKDQERQEHHGSENKKSWKMKLFKMYLRPMEDIMNFPLGMVSLPVVTIHGWDSSSLQLYTKKTTVKLCSPWPRQAIKTKAEEEVKNAKILDWTRAVWNTHPFGMAKRMACFSLDGRKVHQIKTNPLGGGNSNSFYVHPYLGKIPILTNTNMFQMGWFNHQLAPFFLKTKVPQRPGDFFVR